jgi:hypothetical protein
VTNITINNCTTQTTITTYQFTNSNQYAYVGGFVGNEDQNTIANITMCAFSGILQYSANSVSQVVMAGCVAQLSVVS